MATKTKGKREKTVEKKDSEPTVKLPRPQLLVMKSNDKSVTCMLQNVRLVFVYVANPSTMGAKLDAQGQPIEGTYTLSACIPKTEGKFLPALEKIVKDLLKNSSVVTDPKTREKIYKQALNVGEERSLVKDGDETKNKEGRVYEGCEGNFLLRAKTSAVKTDTGFQAKIGFSVKYKNNQPIPEYLVGQEIYAGVWVDLLFTLFCYSNKFGTGISSGLTGIMKLADDTRFGGSDLFEAREDLNDTVVGGLGEGAVDFT